MPGQLEELLENQRELMRRMADIATDNRLGQEWYTTAQQARLKGISHAFLCQNRWARPLGGVGARLIARRWRTHRSAVKQWLLQSDEELLALYGKPADKERYQKSGTPQPRGAA